VLRYPVLPFIWQITTKTSISGKSESTLNNYARCLAHLALHYNCSPEQLDLEQVEGYLHHLKKLHSTPSDSFFKHTVYGLRYVYRMLGMNDRRISLPQIERQKKLPVVMSAAEVRLMLKTPKYLKHKMILAVLYDCGLRCFELRKVELRDVDFDRKMLHVREGKGRKDRYVPLSEHLIRGLKTYIKVDVPQIWLFNGQPDEAGGSHSLLPAGYTVGSKAKPKRSRAKKNQLLRILLDIAMLRTC